ncbi:restriction endonuclease, partial [Helicobacter pylori]
QKSQSSLAFGMNATNSWYHIPIHSYLVQEVCKVTPLEI